MNAASPERPGPAAFRHWLPWLLLFGVVGAVFLVDPRGHNFFPACVFHQWTGWNCPGCGATRATHDLLHGHWVQAFRDNALYVVCLPWFVWGFLAQLLRRPAVPGFNPRGFVILLTVAVAFAVWRNLPAGAWWNP